jgi:hypothetical protein
MHARMFVGIYLSMYICIYVLCVHMYICIMYPFIRFQPTDCEPSVAVCDNDPVNCPDAVICPPGEMTSIHRTKRAATRHE